MSFDIQKHRRIERRHMIAAKNALNDGLDLDTTSGDGQQDFYRACVDYLAMSLGRFHVQGLKNLDHLRLLVPESDAEGREVLADLEAILAASGDEVERLTRAMNMFLAEGPSGRETFERAARSFVAFYDSTLAKRKNPAQIIIGRYVPRDEYWRLTDDFTREVIETETRLFTRIERTAPDGVTVGYVEF